MRTFNVRVHAPFSSVAAIMCVTFGFQDLDTVAPVILPNLTRRICCNKRKTGVYMGNKLYKIDKAEHGPEHLIGKLILRVNNFCQKLSESGSYISTKPLVR